jgi:hypothetical protein
MQRSEINWLPFLNHLETQIGVPVELLLEGGRKTPELKCQNLRQYVGFLQRGLKSVHPHFFNFNFQEEPAKEGEANLWATVYIVLEHKEGGNNQVKLFSCWYYEEEGWIFATPAD